MVIFNDFDGPDGDVVVNLGFHLPCVILLDKSGSMNGEPINALNEVLIDFKDMLIKIAYEDYYLIDISIIAFAGSGPKGDIPDIEILQPFALANDINYDAKNYPIYAYGKAPLAQAVETGLREIDHILHIYEKNGNPYYKPILMCFTNGKSTEDHDYYNYVKYSLKKSIRDHGLITYCIGIGNNCDYHRLIDFFGETHVFKFNDVNNVRAIRELVGFSTSVHS